MAFPFRNPTAASSLTSPEAVGLTTVQGTNFSSLSVGGYMEVFYLSDLSLTLNGNGAQTNSANTIPIQVSLGAGTSLSPTATLTLNSDNISSGRRRLGMLVYVYENDTTYQYTIPNYETLFNAVSGFSGNSGFTFGANSTTVQTRTTEARNFINAWTGSTIEGQGGISRENATWRIFYGNQIQITGGTFNQSNSTISLNNSTGGTITISDVEPIEYIGINSVPASKGINDWQANNQFQDTYIVIPPSLHGRTVTKVSSSYGDISSAVGAIYKVEMKNTTNSVADSRAWGHSANTRNAQLTFDTPMTLTSGFTLNIMYDVLNPPDVTCEGYTTTLEIQ